MSKWYIEHRGVASAEEMYLFEGTLESVLAITKALPNLVTGHMTAVGDKVTRWELACTVGNSEVEPFYFSVDEGDYIAGPYLLDDGQEGYTAYPACWLLPA